MRKEIIQTGATVEEAINSACLRLGYRREECEWDIVDLPKSSFFGLKKVPAKVKVWITLSEEQAKKEKQFEKELEKETVAKQPAQKVVEPTPAKKDSPKPTQKQPEMVLKPISSTKEEPVLTINTIQKPVGELRGQNSEDLEKVKVSIEYINELLNNMGIESTTETRWENEGVTISVSGKGLGALIGRRGETLSSIQYLVGLVANRLEGEYLRVTVDCGDYRLKRNNSLIEMAKKAADQVIKTNVSKTLEVMNPAERRVVHATISEIEGVSSTSVGKDPYRRVMIKTPTSKNPPYKSERGPRQAQGNHGKDNRPRKPREHNNQYSENSKAENAPVNNVVPDIIPKEVGETPLYGKIEL